MIKVDHFELVRRRSANDRGVKRKITVSRQYAHTVWHGSDDVDVAITGYLRQCQTVRQSTGKIDIGHANEVLVAVISENKNTRLLTRTCFFFGQHNVAIAIAIEVGSVNGAFTAGEDICHNSWRERSIAVVYRGAKMKRRKVPVRREE